MAAFPKPNGMTPCPACERQNDPDRGATQCIECRATLSPPWGGDYLINNPPKGGKKK